MNEVTGILSAIHQGDPQAAEQLLPLVYEELRKLAARKLAEEKPGQTLDTTALVHEAYVRLVDTDNTQHWNGRGHFFAAATFVIHWMAKWEPVANSHYFLIIYVAIWKAANTFKWLAGGSDFLVHCFLADSHKTVSSSARQIPQLAPCLRRADSLDDGGAEEKERENLNEH